MQRKLRARIISTAILVTIIFLIFTIPVEIRKSIIINAPVDEVAGQFNKIINWKNWYPHKIDESQSITIINPSAVIFQQSETRSGSDAIITAEPLPDGNATQVAWTQKITIANLIMKETGGRNNITKGLQNLKDFMDDDTLRYGFPIILTPVKDSLILTRKIITDTGMAREQVNIIHKQLLHFIEINGIPADTGYYFVSKKFIDTEETELAVGIPVYTIINEQPGFEFLKLPTKGRLLAGSYNGPYAGKNRLYTAMDKYIMDKHLKKVAQPLEKYYYTDSLTNRNKNISLTLYYPVY